jgi:AcrR family transcriptional regulator
LTRTLVLDRSLELLDREGGDAVTLRRIAADLGVTAMSLYRHVGSKDDLLLSLTDVLLERQGLPPDGLPWTDYLVALAVGLRELFTAHPVVVSVFSRRAVTTPAARARLRAGIAAGVRSGLSEADAVEAYAAVHTYTVGFCALEAGRRASPPVADDGAGAELIVSFVSEDRFRAGLDAMVLGLAARAAPAT